MVYISFVVIGFNIDKYIEKCLRSLMNQTYKNIEIIFVDDGSTDNTANVVKKIQKEDKRIKFLYQKNSGANSARKNGYYNASGKYIIFIDGDDWIKSELAEMVYNTSTENASDIICYNHYYAFRDSLRKDNKIDKINSNKSYLKLIMAEEMPHEFWNKAYKKEFLDKCKFCNIPNITMGDDLLANVFLGLNNPKINIINKPYYYYNQRQDAVTKKASDKTLEIITCLNEIEKLLIKNNIFSQYKVEVDFLWFYHCYYSKVLVTNNKRTYIEKKLYKTWKMKNININNNYLYKRYKEKIGLKNKIKKMVFDINYSLGNWLFSNK